VIRSNSVRYNLQRGAVRREQCVGARARVRYVLEGTAAAQAGKPSANHRQLVEAATRCHIWADRRFDGDLADIFELQDRSRAQVIGAIRPRLELAEIERARPQDHETCPPTTTTLRDGQPFIAIQGRSQER